ncbi:DegT/DnrJ/EryC1/StrS family aminotransferase [Methylobacterium sp. WSM2598]|uniref:DegT/DnrJ/EryC1/StrS family aminotransferase n=1 Tax=Methylobacterium sp. WSM2598 TaxID=398261 RepID=UPI00055D52AF|nr:DegT/DnrJ/EryC1/StrS family aminotransferase [Methylobacterium sp. WSM2598]
MPGWIHTAPEPTLRSALSIARKGRLRLDVQAAQPWMRFGDKPIWLSRSSWGMAALVDALTEANERPVTAWLPEYFCDQALWPMRQRQVELRFYPVDSWARPEWNRIDIAGPGPKLFFLVHFFGHPSDGEQARSVCDATGALLVEDAAHALGPARGIGEVGDFVFYSPWKFFEAPNGAIFVIRPRAVGWAAAIQRSVDKLGSAHSPGLGWAKDIAMRKVAHVDPKGFCRGRPGDFFLDVSSRPMPSRPKASPIASMTLPCVNMLEARRMRQENDAAIRDFFKGRPGWQPLIATPAPGPLRSVFRLDSPERASAAYDALRAVGVRAEGWTALPPEVVDPTSQARLLRRTLLNIPCHQGLKTLGLIEALRRAKLD